MSQESIVSLNDCILVGQSMSGNAMFQSIYGMYIRHDQMIQTERSNMNIASNAHMWTFMPLRHTTLGHTPAWDDTSNITMVREGLETGAVSTRNLLRIRRDYKDVMVANWKNYGATMSFDEFKETPVGFQMMEDFEAAASQVTYSHEWSYEEAVENPHQFFAGLLSAVFPRQDNPEREDFGAPKRHINQDIVDLVIQDSQIRECRESSESNLLEKVGIWKDWLTPAQAEEIDEWASQF